MKTITSQNQLDENIRELFEENTQKRYELLRTILKGRDEKNRRRPCLNEISGLDDIIPEGCSGVKRANDLITRFQNIQKEQDLSFGKYNFAHELIGRNPFNTEMPFIQGVLYNGNFVTRQVSPYATAVYEMLNSMYKQFFDLNPTHQVLMTLGGTEANLLALKLARNQYYLRGISDENEKKQILTSDFSHLKKPKPISLVTESMHYSISNIIHTLGQQKPTLIPVNKDYKMDINKFKEVLQTQDLDSIASITSIFGSTESGSTDDICRIVELAKKYVPKAWLHLDAAYGAPFLRLKKFEKELSVLNEFDSITFDPHKHLFVPYNCGSLILKDPKLLRTISTDAPYIGNDGVSELSDDVFLRELPYHLGSVTMNGSTTTAGVISAYTSFKTLGLRGIERICEKGIENANYLSQILNERQTEYGTIEVINPIPDLNLLNFRFVPKELVLQGRGKKQSFFNKTVCEDDQKYINNINSNITKEFDSPRTQFHISSTTLKKFDMYVNRVVLMDPCITTDLLDHFTRDYQMAIKRVMCGQHNNYEK
ncbi:MAG: pyridoxal phosphate-dependent decarboxylase family protein [Candidatus Woesearchaeota archaeon]